jgi:MFS transporter, DHA1 family, multidrug resistance protein
MAGTLHYASDNRKKLATTLAFISIPLSGFITDIYLPSFPSMAHQLDVSEKDIQLTLTVFFLSYGISQLFVGSLLDSIGRYKASMGALGAIVVTSLLISSTHNVHLIVLFRLLQGISTAFLVVAKRAFFMDLYEGEARKKLLSYFTIVWSCGPIIAPFVGGYLQKLFNWQSNFYFLALYAGVLFMLEAIYSGETIANRKPYRLQEAIGTYKMMLGNRSFVLGILVLGLAYSVALVFNISGPFVIERFFHYGPVIVGYCTLLLGFAWMVGGIISKQMLNWDLRQRVLGATFGQLALITVLLLTGLFSQQLVLLVGFAFLVHTCSGFLYNIFFTNSMLQFPNSSGVAGGLIGGTVYIITSISSFFISSVGIIRTQQDMAFRYLAVSVLLLVVSQMIVGQLAKRKLSAAV